MNYIDHFQKYEICRKQSQCYRLRPPPKLPIFPKLIITNSSSTSTDFPLNLDFYFILLGIIISMISICFLFILFVVKVRIYRKIQQNHRQTNTTSIIDTSTSLPSIFPTSYNSLTPITLTTNRSPSLLMINKLNSTHPLYSNSDTQLSCHNRSINTYEITRLATNHQHCSCCSCTLEYYQNLRYLHTSRPVPTYHYSCISPVSDCQHSISKNSHYKQQCLCQNFFVPIK
ncbi:hypothetical protein I4U23_024383 [Adineta vaga]|nr:hypothetical protein I4U23_024383 [Adineta vaga]